MVSGESLDMVLQYRWSLWLRSQWKQIMLSSGIRDVFVSSSKDPLGIILEHSVANFLHLRLWEAFFFFFLLSSGSRKEKSSWQQINKQPQLCEYLLFYYLELGKSWSTFNRPHSVGKGENTYSWKDWVWAWCHLAVVWPKLNHGISLDFLLC